MILANDQKPNMSWKFYKGQRISLVSNLFSATALRDYLDKRKATFELFHYVR